MVGKYSVNPISECMVSVDAQFIFDPHHDQNHCGQSHCEPKQVDHESQSVLFETSNGSFEIVGEHGVGSVEVGRLIML